jgi:hypothetical protein
MQRRLENYGLRNARREEKRRRWTRRRIREKLKKDSGGRMEVNLNFQAAPGCGPVTNLGREGMEPWSPVQNEGSSLTTIQHTPYGVLLVLPPPIHNADCTLHSSESVASGRHFSSVTDAQARLIENIGCCIGCMNTPRTLLTHQVFEILTSPTSSAYTSILKDLRRDSQALSRVRKVRIIVSSHWVLRPLCFRK